MRLHTHTSAQILFLDETPTWEVNNKETTVMTTVGGELPLTAEETVSG